MNKLKQFILMLVMMFAVFLPLSNLTIKADQTDTSLEDIKKSGKLVVGLSADYPPYGRGGPSSAGGGDGRRKSDREKKSG